MLRNVSADRIHATELAGEPIQTRLTAAPGGGASFGGIKIAAASGWFAARPSGTEAIYKIYAESFRSAGHLSEIQEDAQGDDREPVRLTRDRSQGAFARFTLMPTEARSPSAPVTVAPKPIG